MNTNGTENRFQQLFHEQRDQDAQCAPSFDRVTRVTRVTPASATMLSWLRLAGAVAALLVVTGVSVNLFRARPHRLAFDAQQWAALSDWQASTDVLLDLSNASPAATVPNINSTNPQENQ